MSSCQPIFRAYEISCPTRLRAIGFGTPLSKSISSESRRLFQALAGEVKYRFDFVSRYIRCFGDLIEGNMPASRFQKQSAPASCVLEYPCPTHLARDAFHGGAFCPIQRCYFGRLLSPFIVVVSPQKDSLDPGWSKTAKGSESFACTLK